MRTDSDAKTLAEQLDPADVQLMRAIGCDRDNATMELVHRHWNRVVRCYTRRGLSPDDAEECTNHPFFTTVVEKYAQINAATPAGLHGWACKVVHDTALNRMRGAMRRRAHEHASAELPKTQMEADASFNSSSMAQLLAATRLTGVERKVLELRRQGLTHAQIAEQCGQSVAAIRTAYSRCTDKLRKKANKLGLCILDSRATQ